MINWLGRVSFAIFSKNVLDVLNPLGLLILLKWRIAHIKFVKTVLKIIQCNVLKKTIL